MLLDILITISPETPAAWVNEAVRSCMLAASEARYAVNVIKVPAVKDHIGQAMANGLKLSTAPFVAWVDDDDWVERNAFAILGMPLSRSPVAVCAREIVHYANGHTIVNPNRHHLTAYSSQYAKTQGIEQFASAPNAALLGRLPSNVIDLQDAVYNYRLYRSKGMLLREKLMQMESKTWAV